MPILGRSWPQNRRRTRTAVWPLPLSGFTDDFTTIGAQWSPYGTPAPSIVAGRLNLPCNAGYTGITAQLPQRYALTGSSIIVEAPQTPPAGNGSTQQYLFLATNPGASINRIQINWNNNQLTAQQGANGVSPATIGSATTYNATNHRWWRIRESGGTIYFEAGPDGLTWPTTIATLPVASSPVDPSAITTFELGTGYYGTETAPGPAQFDNLNLPPTATTYTKTGTAAASAGVGGSVARALVEVPAAQPAVVRSAIDTTNATVTTAAFTPPGGSLVVALLSFQQTARATSLTLLANDSSGGGNWAVATHAETPSGIAYSQTAIFIKYFATSPGSITVSAGKSGANACTMSLAVRTLTGARPSQAGAGVYSGYITGTNNALRHAITAAAAGSQVYVVAAEDGNDTQTVVAGTTSLDLWQNATDNAVNAIGKATALTTGAGTAGPYGWTGGNSTNDTAISLLEILAVPINAATYVKTGGGGPTSGVGGAKQAVSPIGGTFIEDVNAVVGTTTVTTGTFVAAPTDGDLAYCYAVNKPSSTAPPAPAGWTQLSSVVVGTGTDGVGTGPVRITVWHQMVAGTFTSPTVTNSGTGAVIAAGIAYIRPNAAVAGTLAVDHTATSAQDLVDDTTWSLTGGADLGVIAQDLVLTVDGWSNNISAAASGGSLSGPGLTVASSSELTDTQLNVGNRGQMVTNLFWGITGASSGAQTHAQTLNAAMTNRTGGTLFVRIRPLGTRVAVVYTKAGGCGGTGAPGGAQAVVPATTYGKTGAGVAAAAPGGAKAVTPATIYSKTGTGAGVGGPGGANAVQNPVTTSKAGTGARVGAPGGAKAVTAAAIVIKAGAGAGVAAPGGAKTRTTAATFTTAGTAVPAGAPGGAKAVQAPITTAKAGTAALAGAPGGARITEHAKTGAGVAAGVPGGAKTVTVGAAIVKAGSGVAAGAPGGAKTVQSAIIVSKAGTSAVAGAPGGAKVRTTAATVTKTGVSAVAAAPGGAKTVVAAGAIVKAGTSALAGVPGGAKTVLLPTTTTKAGTAARAGAPGGAKAVTSAQIVTKAGTAAWAGAPGGGKALVTAGAIVKAGTAAAVGVSGGGKQITAPLTVTKAGTAAAVATPGGPRSVEHSKVGAATIVGAPGGVQALAVPGFITKAGAGVAVGVPGGPARVQTGWLYAGSATDLDGGWIDLPGAVGTSTVDVPATNTGTGAAALTLELGGFGADARVPYNAPLDPIAVWVRHAEDPPELFSAVQARVFVGAAQVGAAQPLTVAAGEHDEIVWVSGLLYADLADLRVRVVATRS